MTTTTAVPVSASHHPSRHITRRLFRWFLILLAVLLFADFVLLPLGIAIHAASSASSEVGAPPDGFRELTLTTSDNVPLAAWYAPTQNGAAVVLIHGSGGSREDIRGHAVMLAANGYGVLAFDARGAGESGGRSNRYGWNGTRDVGAAVDYLAAQPDVQAIGGWGISLGGEMLLGAAGAYPQLAAIIADGATERCAEEKFDLESARGPLVQFHVGFTYALVGLLTGDSPPTPMLASLRASDDVRLLLVAAQNVPDEISYAGLYASAAPGRAEQWIAPDVGHTGAWNAYRSEYTTRVLGFLNTALLSP
jgi:dienelactone hydrolase